MAVKQRKRKANRRKYLLENAVKIKCCYCLVKDDCFYRARKEKSEEMGIMTYCTMTPNVPKKKKSSKRK